MRKLREGADFGWLAANAEGQVDKGAPGLLAFDGRPVTTDSMPDGMQKALAGAKAGEFRLYASPEGHFYVLAVQQVIAPSAETVRRGQGGDREEAVRREAQEGRRGVTPASCGRSRRSRRT